MTQVCTNCFLELPFSDFFMRDKATGARHKSCKACYGARRKDYMKAHYAKYGDEYRKRALKRKLYLREVLRKKMLEYLDNKCCEECGFNNSIALEFDHIETKTKSFSIARALTDCRNWDDILLEIEKCRILCANCHKLRTAEQFGLYRHISK